MPDPSQRQSDALKALLDQALALLHRQKTMALAVNDITAPWVAPVYFVYARQAIHFFSSPRSKHILALQQCDRAAGAIYADADRWQEIQGLQMSGHVEELPGRVEKLDITARYLAKFPLARELMSSSVDRSTDLAARVRLYIFRPTEFYCINNQLGLGHRVKIQIGPGDM
jgi:uncharacterized protein